MMSQKTTVSVVRVCPRAASYHSINTSKTTIITTSPQKPQAQQRQQRQQQQRRQQQPSGLARSKISVSPSPNRVNSSSQRRSVNQAQVKCCSFLWKESFWLLLNVLSKIVFCLFVCFWLRSNQQDRQIPTGRILLPQAAETASHLQTIQVSNLAQEAKHHRRHLHPHPRLIGQLFCCN